MSADTLAARVRAIREARQAEDREPIAEADLCPRCRRYWTGEGACPRCSGRPVAAAAHEPDCACEHCADRRAPWPQGGAS